MERIKSYNSTLHNVSKKRLAEMQAGTYKPKRQKPIRKQSLKSANLWAKARKECLEKYGHKCFLCGATDCEFHIHHWCWTRQQRPDLKYDIDNLCVLCSRCHNHTGADKRFYELKCKIHNKIASNSLDT